MTKFQERVKKLRQEKGISQIELAGAIEVVPTCRYRKSV